VNIVRWTYPHRRGLFVFLALAMLLGVRATSTLGRSIYPHVTFRRIAVIAERGEVPVRNMLASVTMVIERAASSVPGLQRVRSKTLRGASEFSLDFDAGTSMSDALSLVRARVSQAQLPADTRLTIEQQTPAVFPVLSVNVMPGAEDAEDPVARAELAEWVRVDMKSRLTRLPDVFRVSVQSGDRREYVFEPDPEALARAGIGMEAVRDAIAGSNRVEAVGRASIEGLQYELIVDGILDQPAKVLELAVPRADAEPVRLADIGRIYETTAERTRVVTGGGRDGVVVSIFLRDGGKVTDLSRDVHHVIADMQDAVPGGGTIVPVYDQATLVDESIQGVSDAIGLGALLAVLVMALFLGNWRITIVAGLSIPISVAATLAVFPLFGESLNLMSLGGLAVAIGLIIDDAIVVVESIARRLGHLPPNPPAALVRTGVCDGTRDVWGAIVGSSLTTVAVFAPLVLLEGVVGQFFRSLSLALAVSILASMFVSLIYSPLLLLVPPLLPRGGEQPRRWVEWTQERYHAAASSILRHPMATGAMLCAVLLAGVSGLGGLATGFLPEMDEGGFVLDYSLPVGSSLEETDRACRSVEAILTETPEIASFSRRTGAELGFFATEQFTGDMLVGLKARSKRSRTVFEIMDSLREEIAHRVPQVEVEFIQVMQDTIADLAGNPAPLEVKLLGEDYRVLQAAADRVAGTLDSIPGVVDVKNHVSFGSPELTWRVDPVAAARIGLTTRALAAEITGQLLGDVGTRIQEETRFVDVRVRYPAAWRAESRVEGHGPAVFLGPVLDGAEARLVPLSSVASFERHLAENVLERENQTPLVRVTAAVSGTDLGSASRAVKRSLARLHLPSTVRAEQGGQALSQAGAFANMTLVFGLGAGLIFLLLVIQFQSFRLPFVMFLALPFGQLGALHALRLNAVPLNISSGMGLIMLVGLVVKNGIIMIEYAQHLHREGLPEHEAILEAARVRLRPVLMTTLAAIAGLMPLALGIGAGAELQRPLAIAVIGGLAVSTLFTLIVVPLGCATIARNHLVSGDGGDA